MNLTPKEAAAKLLEIHKPRLGCEHLKGESDELIVTVCESIMEQNPADDEEAITIPFCESLGAEIAKGTYSSIAVLGIAHWHEDGTTFLVDSAGNTIRWPVKITTRRQLRCLLRGIGGAK